MVVLMEKSSINGPSIPWLCEITRGYQLVQDLAIIQSKYLVFVLSFCHAEWAKVMTIQTIFLLQIIGALNQGTNQSWTRFNVFLSSALQNFQNQYICKPKCQELPAILWWFTQARQLAGHHCAKCSAMRCRGSPKLHLSDLRTEDWCHRKWAQPPPQMTEYIS